ncbi:hypothetical protein SKAU_G00300320 [Synaphobranchus kaupii]|uniref:Uncharacterized protein n=1 Tax=Synaphobranchus kaupii TaxID=118154 RepID=A0A9Q1IMY9_SYNKA|nr:hypothetical protein SKAU_G00300320 [Synaphobranchus kaupii]
MSPAPRFCCWCAQLTVTAALPPACLPQVCDLPQDPFSSHDDEASDSWSTESIPELSYPLLPEMEAPGWARDGHEGALLSRSARSLMSEEVLEAPRTSDRKGHDGLGGLSSACCFRGCTKSELHSLC